LTDREVHIVSFDVPLPANYGGVIDVYYKVKALHELGYRIHLHAYDYGRGAKEDLNRLCTSVHYYKRNLSRQNLFKRKPFIVVSRNSQELYDRLIQDDHPIIFEGLHSTYYLPHPDFKDRRKIVRTHNIEHEYYKRLGEAEKGIFKRYYYYNEATKLERYETVLRKADAIAAISEPDRAYFDKRYGNAHWISAFHPFEKVETVDGKGNYALYHGNLSVPENDLAALFLVKEVFNDGANKLIIAGNDPSPELKEAAKRTKGVKLQANISSEEIDRLISEAQVNILPTFQATGIKLKLLNALFQGRHALVNSPMVEGTGLEKHCEIADSASEMKDKLELLMSKEFTPNGRTELAEGAFSNKSNAILLDRLIRGDQ
jgi:hypothetical protein